MKENSCNTYKGFSLHHDAYMNISLFIETGMLLNASTDLPLNEAGDLILSMAKKYAKAAARHNSTSQSDVLGHKPTPTQQPDPEEPPLNITERIYARRTELGIESHVLSREIGLDYDMVAEWEDRGGEPVASLIPKLAVALKCDPMWLIGGDPTPLGKQFDDLTTDAKYLKKAVISVSRPNSVGDLGEDGVLFMNPLSKLTNAVEQAETIVTNISRTTLGNRIKIRRKALGLNRLDVATRLRVKSGAISMWERDASSPTCNKLAALAEVLECDPMWLMTGEPLPEIADNHPIEVLQGADWKGMGQRIKQFREEQGITPNGLASYLDVCPAQVIAWEQGSMPASELIDLIAESLGCRTMWLITGKGDPEIENAVQH